jgi:hypothetical protein
MRLPNLFEFATSELSQDAFLCWLVAHAGHDDRGDLRDLARAFIGWLWTAARGGDVSAEQVRLLGVPKKQIDHIDVRFEAEVIGRPVTFIIEDKTETSDHDDQLRRYKESLEARGADVVCIYLKTGYHFGEDERATEHGWTVVGLAEWVAFLHRHQVKHDVFADYRDYVTDRLRRREADLAGLFAPGGYAKLAVASVQYEFIKRLAENCVRTIGGHMTHHGRNRGGTPWTHWRFARFRAANDEAIDEVLFHRVDARNDRRGTPRYYLSCRQYAQVKGNATARAKKLLRLRAYRLAFDDAVKAGGQGLSFDQPAGDNQGANESEIGVLFFDDATNTVEAVLSRFAVVHQAFVSRLAENEAAQTGGQT